MEPNTDRGMWAIVALLIAVVIGGSVMLMFPNFVGQINDKMSGYLDGSELIYDNSGYYHENDPSLLYFKTPRRSEVSNRPATSLDNKDFPTTNLVTPSDITAHGSQRVATGETKNGMPVYKYTIRTPEVQNNFGMRLEIGKKLSVGDNVESLRFTYDYKINKMITKTQNEVTSYFWATYKDGSEEMVYVQDAYKRNESWNNSNNWGEWRQIDFTFYPKKDLDYISRFYTYQDNAFETDVLITVPRIEAIMSSSLDIFSQQIKPNIIIIIMRLVKHLKD